MPPSWSDKIQLSDPLQFANRSNHSTDDAISSTLHLALTNLENKDSSFRLQFIDFSSAFNTIIPQKLINKLNLLGLNNSLCNWILDFLTRRLSQSVSATRGHNTVFVLLLKFFFFFFFCTFHWADLSWLTFHYWLYPVWLCMWQIIKNLEHISEQQTNKSDGFFIIASDFNHTYLKTVLPKFYQDVNFATRGNNTVDIVYTTAKNAYKAEPRPHLGYLDHISVMLIPAYRPLLKLAKPVQNQITVWPENATSALQDWLLPGHRLEQV